MSEGDDTVDLDLFNRLSGNLRRMFETIGIYRVARLNGPVTIKDYLEAKANEDQAP